jgi:hypothetical protein
VVHATWSLRNYTRGRHSRVFHVAAVHAVGEVRAHALSIAAAHERSRGGGGGSVMQRVAVG